MIDKITTAQILDTTNIVDVVSDFVNLRRRGANYIGLCPFHNEKTPSFSVSPAKGICKCFSCGKGGSAVNFIMEHEQLSYPEALRYLAKKYHIEIHERELTDEERNAQSERESMLLINEFAGKFFENQLFETQEGQEIGLPYFYERGFNDATIKAFHLGYSPERPKGALYNTIKKQGMNLNYAKDLGLWVETDRHDGIDRFRGRVMFPVLNVAGKVIAFGGRILSKEKSPAKYINSPESTIYKKHNELYGLFQAKQGIVKEGKCYLVEGYTDVISMHQAGITNVVASSGTSLTEGQIRLIHRFTDNVTVLYDGDAAGIKASLRGINMLLAEGLNIKVLLLPDGEDPDSFAKSHSASEFKEFIAQNETDFIRFKIQILLQGSENDPIKRSKVIQDVVDSIAVIPFPITRSVYARECSRQLEIDEDLLLTEIEKRIEQNKAEKYKRDQRANPTPSHTDPAITNAAPSPSPNNTGADRNNSQEENRPEIKASTEPAISSSPKNLLLPYEQDIIRYVVKYGMANFYVNFEDSNLNTTVVEYINQELNLDYIKFSTPIFEKIFTLALSTVNDFYEALAEKKKSITEKHMALFKEECANLAEKQLNLQEIETAEKKLRATCDLNIALDINEFSRLYLEKLLCSHPDDEIRYLAMKLSTDEEPLSKIHTKFAAIKSEFDRINTLIPEALYNLKNAIVESKIIEIRKKISESKDSNNTISLLSQLQELNTLHSALSKEIGVRVVNPFKR